MPDSTQDRTEPATPRRRREAREQGQVARSNDLAAAVVLLGGLIALYFAARPILARLLDAIRYCLGEADPSVILPDSMPRVGLTVMTAVGYVLLPVLLGLLVASIVVGVAQVGWNPTLKPLTPNLSKLSPLAGFRRLFSAQSLVQLGMNVLKMLIVGAVAYQTLRDRYGLVVSAAGTVVMIAGYVLAVVLARQPLGAFSRAMLPVHAVALSTQSSLACLPAMLGATRKLGVRESTADFVLPLAVAIFRGTSPAMNMGVAIYAAYLTGTPLSVWTLAVGVLVAFLVSLSSVSLPGTLSFVISVGPIANAMGVPIAPLALLVAVEMLPDLMRTLGNVTMDVAVTAAVDRE